jgi:ElaB/YqjD/DUF883 family membrane-anchored ribosome-binding protein
MSAEPLNRDTQDPGTAIASEDAIDSGRRAFKDALAAAEKRLSDAARTAERAIRDGVETLKAETKAYSGPASQTVDEAQRYVIERVKERPVTAALAGLGVGFLLGMLLSSRGK